MPVEHEAGTAQRCGRKRFGDVERFENGYAATQSPSRG